LYRRPAGTTESVSTSDDDELLEGQEGTGYGEDEGERDDALESELGDDGDE
jgi:hypothetical protein